MDHLREECGIFGVFGDSEASNLVYLGLYALQHRGQEGCGIVTVGTDRQFHAYKALGLVADAIDRDRLSMLPGSSAIGHVRYSTFGGKGRIENVQPFAFRTSIGRLAICHNGNLTNADSKRRELEEQGAIFQSSSDTEIFMHLIAKAGAENFLDRISIAMRLVKGAYSLLLMSEDRLFAIRDPFGFRPLVLGKRGNAYVVASETCALDLIDAEYLREVNPGEIVEISRSGLTSHQPLAQRPRAVCSFEPIYFSRPDSRMGETDIYSLRKRMGRVLAEESPVEADVVVAIPDSGVPMAMGYSEATGLPSELGLIRNHYIGRTFIEPTQAIRDFGVKLKLNPVMTALRGKRVVLLDDSIVRGTTSVKIVRMLRTAGVAEVHVRIGSPPITHSCYFGVDTPERTGLIAAQQTVTQIRDFIGSDSLAFLSREGLQRALGVEGSSGYCYGCFSGKYPEDICQKISVQPTDEDGPGIRA